MKPLFLYYLYSMLHKYIKRYSSLYFGFTVCTKKERKRNKTRKKVCHMT